MDNWEIEWGTSMMKHGADLGTMEFIFAKGGDMSDVNYVMFDVNDSSYEPLIKAVAERENSHPDIIRKQAFSPTVMPTNMQPAVAVGDTAAVRGGVRAKDVRNTNRALNAAAAGERVRGGSNTFGDLAQAGLYGRAAGVAGRAAGSRIAAFGRGAAEKARSIAGAGKNQYQRMMQSGAGQRMKNFMSGAGRTVANLRELPGAVKEVGGKMMENKENEARRRQIEADASRYGQSIAAIERETGGPSSPTYQNRMDSLDRSPLAQRQKRQQDELTDLNAELARNRVGVRDVFRTMNRRGQERRDLRNAPVEEARAFREGDETTAEVTEALNQNPQAEEAARGDEVPVDPNAGEDFSDLDLGGPETETPPMVSPQPTPAEPKPPNPMQFYDENIAGQYQEGEKPYGSGSMKRRMAAIAQQGGYGDFPAFPGTEQGRAAAAVLARMGFPPPQANKVAAAAEKGDPEAQEMVQVAMEDSPNAGEDFSDLNLQPSAEDLVQMSQDKHTASWDSLLKNLDIR